MNAIEGIDVFEQYESNIRGYCRLYPTVFASASNARQVDEAGKSYIDFFAGAGVLNFGHNNPRMKRALIDFIEGDGVAHSLDMHTTVKREFIRDFVDTILAPREWDYRLMFMGPTGTNAVESALKLARKVTGRRTVVAYTSGFHGMTLGSLAATANSYFRNAAGVPLEHVLRQPFGCEKTCLGCDMGCGVDSVAALRAQYADPSSGLEPPAAFLVEAIQAEGGVHVASAAWLQAVQQLARDLGALFIIDDIQAGCGRCGTFFSFEGMDVEPDMVPMAKSLSGYGLPFAALLLKPELDIWKPAEHNGTFRGNTHAFVTARVALEKFWADGAFQAELAEKAAYLETRLEAIAGMLPDARLKGRGFFRGVDVGSGELAAEVCAECFDKGVVIETSGAHDEVVKVLAPLTIEKELLARGLDIVEAAVASRVAARSPAVSANIAAE